METATTIRVGDKARIAVSDAHPLPSLSAISSWPRTVEDAIEGYFEGVVLDIRDIETTTGDTITRATLRWPGVDGSGWFAEWHHAIGELANFEPIEAR